MVIFKSNQVCLTQLGFSLKVVPLIMKSGVSVITSQDHVIKSATLAYINDIFINENLASVACVQQHFLDYSLVCKNPEWLRNETKVLDLQVWGENSNL